VSEAPRVERVIGVPGVAFTIFNSIVGAGIFGLPGLVALTLGSGAIFAYLVSLVLVGLLGLCFAEAGSRVIASGGFYAYANAAFGPVVGGVTGLLLFTKSIISAAALARFLLDTLAGASPYLALPWAGIALLALIYVVLAGVNIMGTSDGSRLTVALGLIKLTPMFALILVGFLLAPVNHIAWPEIPSVASLGDGTLVLFFAFLGLESGLNISGETRNPRRTVPRAIALALMMVAILYIGLQLSAQNVLGPALPNSQAPLIDMARVTLGESGAYFMFGVSVVSVLGYLIGDILSSPRIGYALAEAGQMPRWFRYVHPRRHTPSVAIAIYAVLVVLVTASGSFEQLALITVSGTLMLYLVTCIGLFRLRKRRIADAGDPFITPGRALEPIAAAAIILWLLSTLAWMQLGAAVLLVAAATLFYGLRERRVSTLLRQGGDAAVGGTQREKSVG
jgi:APA family basic amino acid/polyamine antiporter